MEVHDEEQSGRHSVTSDHVQNVDQKICGSWCFTISELLYMNFHKFNALFSIRLSQLGLDYQMFYTGWVLKMLTVHTENSFGFDFFSLIPQRWQ
jgi:hypothetical protein